MNRSIQDQEIVLFRYRNRLLAGVCQEAGRGKVRFALSKKEAVNVPVENLLLATGAIANDSDAGERWMTRAEAEGENIELAEVWDLVRDEDEVWGVEDLAEFYYGQEATPEQVSALLVNLETSRYFAAEGVKYCALSEADVAERLAAEARREAREAEQALFQKWFDGKAEVEAPLLADWMDRLKAYVLDGPESPHGRWVERMAGRKPTVRKVFDLLVDRGVWEADEFLDLIRAEVPVIFSPVLIEAGNALDLAPLIDDSRRRDLTRLDVMTIDDASTTDMDDGISIQIREDGSSTVGVHITDVSALVAMGSELDLEALERGASLYFPDQKIPMLPKRISSDLGSLWADVPRLALSFLFHVNEEDEIGTPEVVPSVICCREKLSYDVVDTILEDPGHRLYSVLTALYGVAEAHLVERMQEGAVPLEQVNRRVSVAEDGEIQVSLGPRNSRADVLVSELMVMVNVSCARLCHRQGIPMVYRTQVAPDLSEFEDTEDEVLYRYRLLRRMRPASSSLEPGLHGGLGVSPYCQVSSPLRRYADLVVQRQLLAALQDAPTPYDEEQLREIAARLDERMRLIGRLEWRRERYWIYKHFESLRGKTFEAVVLEVWKRAFRAEIVGFALQAEVRLTRPVTPGERVSVRLGRCDPWADEIMFLPVD